MSGEAQGPSAANRAAPVTRLPGLRRRRRSLTIVACVVFALGVLGVSNDARRVLGDPFAVASTSGTGSVAIPDFSYEFAGAEADPLQRPVGISVTDRRIYVADSLAGRIAVFREGGRPDGYVGQGRLDVPVYVTADVEHEELLVTDRGHRALFAFGFDGSFIETLAPHARSAEESAALAVWAPIAVTYADDGTVYVTDVGEVHRVWHLERTGEVLGVVPAIGAPAEATATIAFDFPNAVVATAGRVWVADSNNRRMVELDGDGDVVRSVPLGRLIRGLAMLPVREGEATRPHFALIDAFSHEVVLVSDAGSEVGRIGGPGAGGGGLAFPNDVAVTETGVYVADTGNARVQVYEWRPASGLASLVWPGGPSWLGLLSAPLLLAPLALVTLRRPVRVVASYEAITALHASLDPDWRWRRVVLVVTPDVGRRVTPRPGPRVEVSEFSQADAAGIARTFELDDAPSQTLSLALRHRVLLAEDPVLVTVAAARGAEVLDVAGFIEEFALPTPPEQAEDASSSRRRGARSGRGRRR